MSWTTLTKPVGNLTWATAAAILVAQLTPVDPQIYDGVCSEILCWVLVIIWVPAARYYYREVATDFVAPPIEQLKCLLVAAAGAISLIALSSAWADISWLIPAVTPALTILRHTVLLPNPRSSSPKQSNSIFIQLGIGVTSVIILLPPLNYIRAAIAIFALIYLVLLSVIMVKVLEHPVDTETVYESRTINSVDIMKALAWRVPAFLLVLGLVYVFLSPYFYDQIPGTLSAACLKAAHWILLFSIIENAPWEIATTIWTCAAASHAVFTVEATAPLELLRIVLRIAVGFVSVYQTIAFIPKSYRGRYWLFLFAIWPIISLLNNSSITESLPSLPGGFLGAPASSPSHPIEQLILKAQADFGQLIKRQSRTLELANEEYRRRYLRDPPPGFDKWFAYAKSHNSVFIDEFDMINDDLKPFWNVSPKTLLESINHVTQTPNDKFALRKCGFTNGKYNGQGGGWIVDDLGGLLQDVASDLPNVEFAFNVVDEPREIIAQDLLKARGVSEPDFTNVNHRSIWQQVIGPCQTGIHEPSKPAILDHGIPFVQNWSEAKDVCLHPEFEYMHGFFNSPETCILTSAPVPVLSQAAPSSFGDIMYPSPWYAAKYGQMDYDESEDPPWKQKANNLYWAGSSTGSHSRNGSWKHSHRQRLATLIKTLPETSYKYLKETKPGVWESYDAAQDLRNLFDVKLTAVIQCDDADCEEQKQFFDISDREEHSQQFQSKFVFDTDGNSFSGRYYTLLQSRSVVLKQTVLREWHDERLFPWLHYLPVSLSMDELPEMMRYMTTNDLGKKRAKEIADASRKWQRKVLRREDFTIYLYRLMLELARIMDPNREVV